MRSSSSKYRTRRTETPPLSSLPANGSSTGSAESKARTSSPGPKCGTSISGSLIFSHRLAGVGEVGGIAVILPLPAKVFDHRTSTEIRAINQHFEQGEDDATLMRQIGLA
jgi:hypothetical protein